MLLLDTKMKDKRELWQKQTLVGCLIFSDDVCDDRSKDGNKGSGVSLKFLFCSCAHIQIIILLERIKRVIWSTLLIIL